MSRFYDALSDLADSYVRLAEIIADEEGESLQDVHQKAMLRSLCVTQKAFDEMCPKEDNSINLESMLLSDLIEHFNDVCVEIYDTHSNIDEIPNMIYEKASSKTDVIMTHIAQSKIYQQGIDCVIRSMYRELNMSPTDIMSTVAGILQDIEDKG